MSYGTCFDKCRFISLEKVNVHKQKTSCSNIIKYYETGSNGL